MSTDKNPLESKSEQAEPGDLPLQASPPELWLQQFVRKQLEEPGESDGFELNFRFVFNRITLDELLVQFEIESAENPFVAFHISCKANFRLGDGGHKNPNYDDAFKLVVTNVAVTYLFPFLREALASASVKAGMAPLVLPIINFRNELKPDELEIPSFNPEGTQERG